MATGSIQSEAHTKAHILVDGVIVICYTTEDMLFAFTQRWTNIINKLKSPHNADECKAIWSDFSYELSMINSRLDSLNGINAGQICYQIYAELNMALLASYYAYKKESKLLQLMFWKETLKLPPINLNL